jgi:hypothetical protein
MILIAILTLLLGGAAIYVVNRAKVKPTPLAGQSPTTSTPIAATEPAVRYPTVKRLYLGRRVGRSSDGVEEQVSLVVFYEGGEWGRFEPMIKRSGRTLEVRCEELCTAERGSWRDDGRGNVVFVSNTFVCPICPYLREDVTRRPIEEVWRYDGENFRNRRGRVIGEVAKYELIDTSQLANYQSVYLPFEMKDSGMIF